RELEQLFCGEDEPPARAAFNELWRRHEKELRTQANCQCGRNEDLSNEEMQQLYVRLWDKRKSYNPDKGRWINMARSVLWHIHIDAFRDPFRKRTRASSVPADQDVSPGDRMDRFVSREPDPDRQLKLKELQQAMADCLQGLSSQERDTLVLQVVDG